MFLLLTIHIFFLINILHSSGEYFNYESVKVVPSSSSSEFEDIYFGYSVLLLQGTKNPIVVVGAPKQKNDANKGGSLYNCNINSGNCNLLRNNFDRNISDNSLIGDWLGSNIVQGNIDVNEANIFTCAPRLVTKNKLYYMVKGQCYKVDIFKFKLDTESLTPMDEFETITYFDEPNSTYYKSAYAQAGFDFKYLPLSNKSPKYDIIYGAPGFDQWNGAVVIHTFNDETIIVKETINFERNHEHYLGYSVLGERSSDLNEKFTIIAGAPRHNHLQGAVFIFTSTNRETILTKTINGPDEIGSYFGALLLWVDMDGDQNKDLFIAAPIYSGKTWDEGAVFYYKSRKIRNNFDVGPGQILTGENGKSGARFGTSMTALGDINLDGFNDVAISAPYEDETGAVYIFMGSKNGPKLSEIILPKKFQHGSNIKGFGLGLSNGKDVDNNGHNDIAIGAYKSGKVFILKTKSIVNCSVDIIVPKSISLSTAVLPVQYCIRMNWKNKERREKVRFNVTLVIDERGNTDDKLNTLLNLTSNKLLCRNVSITIQNRHDYENFLISVRAQPLNQTVLAEGKMFVEKEILFEKKLCENNKCFPKLALRAKSLTPNLILGLTRELKVEVNLENSGDIAYDCYLDIYLSKGLELRKNITCEEHDETGYRCSVSNKFINSKTLTFTFDINELEYGATYVELKFFVISEGEFDEPPAQSTVNIPILTLSTPYAEGMSMPKDIEYPTKSNRTEILHIFNIGNIGPTQFNLKNVYIFIPDLHDLQLMSNVEASLKINRDESKCSLTEIKNNHWINFHEIKEPEYSEEDIFNVDCSTGKCLQVLCIDDNYLLQKSEIASYSIKFVFDLNMFVDSLEKQKNILGFRSTSFITNNNNNTDTIDSNLGFYCFIYRWNNCTCDFGIRSIQDELLFKNI